MSGDDPQERPLTPADAQRHGMSRLKRALLARQDHAARAEGWREVDRRNHFGPSIAAAMRLGRNNHA